MRTINYPNTDEDRSVKAQKFFDDAKLATLERNDIFDEAVEESPDTKLRNPSDIEKDMSERNRAISDLYRKAAEYV